MSITDERALELLRENFAEPNGWDWCHEYGEPGYSFDGDQQVLVLGNYWCRCRQHPHAGKPLHRGHTAVNTDEFIKPGDLHDIGSHHPRLWARFEEVAEFEWHDQWTIDHENDKAYRTTGDSYGWTPSYTIREDGEILTPDDDPETWIDHALEDRRALYRTQLDETKLVEAGFERYPDDDTYYESGWHPGQTDDPVKIMDAANEAGLDVIIYVTGQGQFDTRWIVYTRPHKEEE